MEIIGRFVALFSSSLIAYLTICATVHRLIQDMVIYVTGLQGEDLKEGVAATENVSDYVYYQSCE
ncbi:hypothetical protein [Bacillus sp. USDA818B3_A]|uniref:hypothetical protein n=1 Tax=Bacillus sp. USDA818B3_A TaxID=2698834 RepID=UPI001F2209E4|nr:hypothetical protein [Bacillus sp. USDA818B3_A]